MKKIGPPVPVRSSSLPSDKEDDKTENSQASRGRSRTVRNVKQNATQNRGAHPRSGSAPSPPPPPQKPASLLRERSVNAGGKEAPAVKPKPKFTPPKPKPTAPDPGPGPGTIGRKLSSSKLELQGKLKDIFNSQKEKGLGPIQQGARPKTQARSLPPPPSFPAPPAPVALSKSAHNLSKSLPNLAPPPPTTLSDASKLSSTSAPDLTTTTPFPPSFPPPPPPPPLPPNAPMQKQTFAKVIVPKGEQGGSKHALPTGKASEKALSLAEEAVLKLQAMKQKRSQTQESGTSGTSRKEEQNKSNTSPTVGRKNVTRPSTPPPPPPKPTSKNRNVARPSTPPPPPPKPTQQGRDNTNTSRTTGTQGTRSKIPPPVPPKPTSITLRRDPGSDNDDETLV